MYTITVYYGNTSIIMGCCQQEDRLHPIVLREIAFSKYAT